MPFPIVAFTLFISFLTSVDALPVPFVRIDVSASPQLHSIHSSTIPAANFFDIRQQPVIEDTQVDPDGPEILLHITMSVDKERNEGDGISEEEYGMETLLENFDKALCS